MSDLQHQAPLLGERDELVGFSERRRDRLLDEQMQTVFQAVARHAVMAIGRHGDDRGIRLAENLAIVGQRGGAELLGERRRACLIRVDHRGELHAAQRRQLLGVITAHVAGANDRGFQ